MWVDDIGHGRNQLWHFFLHSYFISGLRGIRTKLLGSPPEGTVAAFLLFTGTILFLCIATVQLTRKAPGANSPLLIGNSAKKNGEDGHWRSTNARLDALPPISGAGHGRLGAWFGMDLEPQHARGNRCRIGIFCFTPTMTRFRRTPGVTSRPTSFSSRN